MAVDCTPNALVEASRCFDCLTPDQKQSVIAYLLAVIAGGSTDPTTLLENARCFQGCLTIGQLKAIQVYLLCQIAP